MECQKLALSHSMHILMPRIYSGPLSVEFELLDIDLLYLANIMLLMYCGSRVDEGLHRLKSSFYAGIQTVLEILNDFFFRCYM